MVFPQHDVVDATTGFDDDDDVDDGYTPPVPVRVDTRLDLCPACEKPMKKHGALELLRCAEAVERQEEDGGDEQGGHRYGHSWAPAGSSPPSTSSEGRPVYGPPVHVEPRSEYERWQDELKGTFPEAPAPPRPPQAEPEPPEPNPHAPAARRPHVLDENWSPDGSPVEELPPIAPAVTADDVLAETGGLPAGIIPLPGGGIDYEALAAAMRVVIERERDEVVKRGGPLEKQNQELKERLAGALEEAALWRRRAQSNAERANSFEAQLLEKIKEMRKNKAQRQGDRSGERPKVVEINDILKVVRQTPGFEVRKQGNGHWGIYKDNVFVVDAASSGQGNKVNMATRVALKKAGVNV